MPRRTLFVERVDENGLLRPLLGDVTIPDGHEVKVVEADDHVHVQVVLADIVDDIEAEVAEKPAVKKSAARKPRAKKAT